MVYIRTYRQIQRPHRTEDQSEDKLGPTRRFLLRDRAQVSSRLCLQSLWDVGYLSDIISFLFLILFLSLLCFLESKGKKE